MECGQCTACCTLYPVEWLDKPVNTPCIHCDNGCKIQDAKPKECSDFNCAYLQMKSDNINLRPDNCGIIFEKHSERIFYGILIPDMEISKSGHGQIQSFLNQGYSVVLSSISERHNKYLISQNHKEDEIRMEFKEIVDGYLQH